MMGWSNRFRIHEVDPGSKSRMTKRVKVLSSCHPGQGPGIHSINSPAFTIFEVLISLGILVAMVSIVANFELRSLLRVLGDRDELEKVFFIKKDQYIQSLKNHIEQKKYTQKLEEPRMKYISMVNAINPKSSLASLRHRLFIVHTIGTWKYERVEH